MSNVQQLRQAAARCLSLLQRYHHSETTPAAKARMSAEVEVIIGWLIELDLPPGAAESGVIRPVETHLLSQYGRQEGGKLHRDFLQAFAVAGMPLTFMERYRHLRCPMGCRPARPEFAES